MNDFMGMKTIALLMATHLDFSLKFKMFKAYRGQTGCINSRNVSVELLLLKSGSMLGYSPVLMEGDLGMGLGWERWPTE